MFTVTQANKPDKVLAGNPNGGISHSGKQIRHQAGGDSKVRRTGHLGENRQVRGKNRNVECGTFQWNAQDTIWQRTKGSGDRYSIYTESLMSE